MHSSWCSTIREGLGRTHHLLHHLAGALGFRSADRLSTVFTKTFTRTASSRCNIYHREYSAWHTQCCTLQVVYELVPECEMMFMLRPSILCTGAVEIAGQVKQFFFFHAWVPTMPVFKASCFTLTSLFSTLDPVRLTKLNIDGWGARHHLWFWAGVS